MKTYNEIIELALKKGYRPRVGKSMALRKNYNDEDVLIRMTSIQKWLRDKYGIFLFIHPAYSYVISSDYSETITTRHFAFDSYEQALSEGIYKSLKLIK